MGPGPDRPRVSSALKAAGRPDALAEVSARDVRTDIQGLRALAVGLVLLFHLWPEVIRGGYVGVDVFFVISGFLITSHLLRNPPHSVGGFAAFWGRRLRRLLPASLLVLVVTVLVGVVVLPVNQLANLGRDALSSVFYVENWTLALNAVDYLGATQAPSPFQHYWSLGVEEQFYLLWPFVVAVGVWVLGRALRGRTAGAALAIGAFALASLLVSVLWTAGDPAFAYFATPTRLWELAAGGAVALLPSSGWLGRIPAATRAVAGWAGLALIVVAALAYTEATPFPGIAAALPVGGACLLIAARSGVEPWSPGRLLALRPAQFLGDTSYAIYLWHFPLIVLGTAALGALTLPVKLVVIVASVALAQATRVLVEDPVRRSTWLRARERRTYVAAVVVTLLAVGVTLVPQAQVQRLVAAQAEEQAENDIVNAGCAGAAALADDDCDLRGAGITPDPAVAVDDRSDAYARGCLAERPFSEVITCDFGVADGANRIALVGNSHAVQWIPALEKLAPGLNLSITTYVASRCAVSTAPQVFDTTAITEGCLHWGRDVLAETRAGGYDLIIVTAASDGDLVGPAAADQFDAKADGYRGALQEWADAGQRVLVLRDTPQPQSDVVGCVAVNLDDLAACDGNRAVWLPPDPLVVAAASLTPAVPVADLSSLMCASGKCYSVIGGVLVYFDPRHISATFSESLAPFLAPSLENSLRAG